MIIGIGAFEQHDATAPASTIVRVEPEPVSGYSVTGLAKAASGTSAGERFGHLLPPDRIPSHTPLVLLWHSEVLSSPDSIAVTRATTGGHAIDLHIEQRRFLGPLHANMPTVAIVEMDLGRLEPGRYDVSIQVTELWFSKYGHPENAGDPSTQHSTVTFDVR